VSEPALALTVSEQRAAKERFECSKTGEDMNAAHGRRIENESASNVCSQAVVGRRSVAFRVG
jgi:hypothetical protein